eukprot:Rhum_TRINITY_DN3616_c0_g2::Rhum_TRINITY_DN3616_c0_g2_i1::g.11500::m.11500
MPPQEGDLGDYLQAAVDHITANAGHYFDVVNSHGRRGLLWLVFLTGVTGDDAPSGYQTLQNASGPGGESLKVKSISFLPLEAVQSSQSASLMKMYDTYDPETQFVCWYTLESQSNLPLYSKVVVVDSTQPQVRSEESALQRRHSIGDTPLRDPDYPSLLKMTMEIADAASKMSATIDSLNARVAELTERADLADRGLKAVLEDGRTSALEAKVSVLEGMLVQMVNAQHANVYGGGDPAAIGAPPSASVWVAPPATRVTHQSSVEVCRSPVRMPAPVSPQTHTARPLATHSTALCVSTSPLPQLPRHHDEHSPPMRSPEREPVPPHPAPQHPVREAPSLDTQPPPIKTPVPKTALDDMIARFEAKLSSMSVGSPTEAAGADRVDPSNL